LLTVQDKLHRFCKEVATPRKDFTRSGSDSNQI